jgi:hypothetical protein
LIDLIHLWQPRLFAERVSLKTLKVIIVLASLHLRELLFKLRCIEVVSLDHRVDVFDVRLEILFRLTNATVPEHG